MEKPIKTEYVSRVNQLDAIQLDTDITRIIREQLVKSIQHVWPRYLSQYQPELDLLIRTTIWKLSVHLKQATFGQQLLFTSYDPATLTQRKYILHFICTVILKYLKDLATLRLTRQLIIQKCVTWVDTTLTIVDFVNGFRFLKYGKKPSVVDYLLGLDYISMYGNKRRDIGYSHMTRELIWGGFMELLGFTLPLINYHAIKRRIRNFFQQQKLHNSNNQTINNQSASIMGQENNKLCKITLTTKCIYCNERPTMPYHMGCSHIYCYYCLQANLMADENFQCLICDRSTTDIFPV